MAICLVAIGRIFIFLNKDNLSLESIMGNSTYIATMKKVQNSTKYDEIKFIPTLKKNDEFYLKSKEDIRTNFINQLNYNQKKYDLIKVQFFKDGKYLKTINSNTKSLSFSDEYIGKTLALRYYIKDKITGKIYTKYSKLLITNYLISVNDTETIKKQLIDIIKKANDNDYVLRDSVIKECKIEYADMRWPLYSGILYFPKITVDYGNVELNGKKKMHYGIDISTVSPITDISNLDSNNDTSLDVLAIYKGKVVKVVNKKKKNASNDNDYGTYVVLEHRYNGEKLYSIYANMRYNSILKNIKVGQNVSAGTKLGKVNDSDFHFEMRKNDIKSNTRKNNNVNPLDYISNEIKWNCEKELTKIN